MFSGHVDYRTPCVWNIEKWVSIFGVYLSKCAHSILLFYLWHQTWFICCLTVLSYWHRGRERKQFFPLSTQENTRRGKTHLRFVWYNHFLERVYSQAFRALSFFHYFCCQDRQRRLIFPEKPMNMFFIDLNTVCCTPLHRDFRVHACFTTWMHGLFRALALKMLLSACITSGMCVLSSCLEKNNNVIWLG